MRSWRPDFFSEKAKNAISAYVHLEGLAKSFSLMCSPRQSGRSWTRGLISCIPKVFFLSKHGVHFWPWDPIILFEMINFRVSMNVTCEVFVKGFRLIFLPLKTDSIWVQTLTPRDLKQFFQLSQRATILGWRPIFLDDLVKTVTNVSRNCEDYE